MRSVRSLLFSTRALLKARGGCKKYLSTTSVVQCDNNVVKSPFPDVTIPNISLDEYVWTNLDKYGNKTAVVCSETDRSYSYEDARKLSSNVAQAFRNRLGLQKGDVIAVVMPNIPEYCITVLGALEAGITVSTVNPIYTSEEISRQIVLSGAKALVTLSAMYPVLDAARKKLQGDLKNMEIVTVRHLANDASPDGAIDWTVLCNWSGTKVPLGGCESSDLAFLPYSSGTTGLPKGVELTHRNIIANLQQYDCPQIQTTLPTTATQQDGISAVLPMFHIYGLTLVFLNAFSRGCKLVTSTRFTPQTYISMLNQYKPEVLYAAPPLILFLISHPEVTNLDFIRVIVSGAAPLASSDISRFYAKFKVQGLKITQGYGLTEASPMTHTQTCDSDASSGGIGWTVPSTESRIISLEDDKTSLGPGESGQLAVRGPQVMRGYRNDPAATKSTIDSEGWFRTGDIGYYDKDKQFFITDRLKELIKVKGFQVAPAELEALLRDHPGIKDAAVVGVPDPNSGQAPKAFVVRSSGDLTEKAVQEYVAGKVAPFKKLAGGVVFLEAIPKSSAGKILRRELVNL